MSTSFGTPSLAGIGEPPNARVPNAKRARNSAPRELARPEPQPADSRGGEAFPFVLHLRAPEAIHGEDVQAIGVAVDQGEDGDAAARECCHVGVRAVPGFAMLTVVGDCLIAS